MRGAVSWSGPGIARSRVNAFRLQTPSSGFTDCSSSRTTSYLEHARTQENAAAGVFVCL